MELKSLGKSDIENAVWNRILGNLTNQLIIGYEIGCLYGESAETILESNPNIFLTSIDPFIPDSMAEHLIGDKNVVFERLKRFEERFALIEDYSWNIAPLIKNESLNFVFLDGDHRYESVLIDFNDWTPKIKIGGLLFMHDARMYRPIDPSSYHLGPSKVVSEKLENNSSWKIIDEGLSLICARRIS